MSYYRPPYTFLVMFEDEADATKVGAAIAQEKLGYDQLGKKTFLAFFFDRPEETYAMLKKDYGVTGPVHWIQLPYTEVTGAKEA